MRKYTERRRKMNETNEQINEYQDPITAQSGEKPKKKVASSSIIATVVCVVLISLVGIVGALICYAGFWSVRAIIKNNRLPMAAKIILSILVTVVFIVVFIVVMLALAAVMANI